MLPCSSSSHRKQTVLEHSFKIMSSSQPYFYEPLVGNVGIRLLLLEPGAPGETPLCSWFFASLADDVEYEALSYVLENPKETSKLLCSDACLQVTNNLHSGLCHLRYEDAAYVLWVDAICISLDRYRTKYCRDLRDIPLFYEELGFPIELRIRAKAAPPYPSKT
jgi:hypothetical protein